MKSKKIFLFLVMLIAFLGIVTLSNKVNAATISDDGKYSLLLTANEMYGCFDGEYAKLVRFNIAEGETTVKLPENLKGFNKYEVVYIKDGKIEENIEAKIDGDYLVFKTTHLSEYGIIATNTTNTSNSANNTEDVSNPKTGDNIVIYVAMACASIIGMGLLSLNIKRK